MCVKAASAGRSDALMVCRYENWRRHVFDTIGPRFTEVVRIAHIYFSKPSKVGRFQKKIGANRSTSPKSKSIVSSDKSREFSGGGALGRLDVGRVSGFAFLEPPPLCHLLWF